MEATVNAKRKTTRLAASLFFFLCIPIAIWGMSYVSKIFVAQDPVATAEHLLANEFLFRMSILANLAGTIIFVVMMLMFYKVFKSVDPHLSRLMIVMLVSQISAVFVFEAFEFTALMVLKGEARSTFNVAQQQEAAYFLLRMQRYGVGAGLGKLFLGLSFIPFGMLVVRSGLTPRIIGILLIIGGVGYVADTCISILLQRVDYLMVRSYLIYTSLGYILALLWFLFMGVREQQRSGIEQ